MKTIIFTISSWGEAQYQKNTVQNIIFVCRCHSVFWPHASYKTRICPTVFKIARFLAKTLFKLIFLMKCMRFSSLLMIKKFPFHAHQLSLISKWWHDEGLFCTYSIVCQIQDISSLAEKLISSTHSTLITRRVLFFRHEFDIYTVGGSPWFGRNRLQHANVVELLQRQNKVHVSSKMQNINRLSVCLSSYHSRGGCCRIVERIGNWTQRIL